MSDLTNALEIKRHELEKLKERLEFRVEGLSNHPKGSRPVYYFANHSRLMDIFYLSAAVPTNQVVIVSNRLVYKPIIDRQQIINRYLFTLPLEQAKTVYANLSIDAASTILANGINMSIFPEGIYNSGATITRGRKGMACILFETCKKGVQPYLFPVAIEVKSDNSNLDRYTICESDKIIVRILEPLNYEYLIPEYLQCDNPQEQEEILHTITDIGMQNIADALGVPFTGEYDKGIPKKNIMLPDGSTISFEEANDEKNIKSFKDDIESRTKRLIRVFKK